MQNVNIFCLHTQYLLKNILTYLEILLTRNISPFTQRTLHSKRFLDPFTDLNFLQCAIYFFFTIRFLLSTTVNPFGKNEILGTEKVCKDNPLLILSCWRFENVIMLVVQGGGDPNLHLLFSHLIHFNVWLFYIWFISMYCYLLFFNDFFNLLSWSMANFFIKPKFQIYLPYLTEKSIQKAFVRWNAQYSIF